MFEAKLIALYFYICEKYEKELKYYCQRFSNNKTPVFTDEEVLTVYLYVMHVEKRFRVSDIHSFASRYLRSWFPKLPSYQAFNHRLNRLSEVFRHLSICLLEENRPEDCSEEISLIDSMPVITCSGKRNGKVAPELTCKGRCAAKGIYYYGAKLHVVGWKRSGTMPWPEAIIVTNGSENDLSLFKQACGHWTNHNFYGDKIYHNKDWFKDFETNQNSTMSTPVKAIREINERIEKFDRAANDLYSKAVSSIRQPIESLFNWLIEKTDIQRASKVRSSKGLLVHLFGRWAVAFISYVLNP